MSGLLPASVWLGKELAAGFIASLMCVWTMSAPGAAGEVDKPTVRHIGRMNSPSSLRVVRQIQLAPLGDTHDTPILLQGETVARLHERHRREIKATYQAGFSIVLLDANFEHIRALHQIVGEGVTYHSKNVGMVMTYSLRKENYVPTATVLTNVNHSALRTANDEPDPTGLLDTEAALDRVATRTVLELKRPPKIPGPGPVRDPNQPIAWQENALQTFTFAVNDPSGVYNTSLNVYALHRCLDGTDHYVVTADADWTATNAKWQGATSQEPDPSFYVSGGNIVINWQDNRTYCSSGGAFASFHDICRYINYPLSYELRMVPRNEGTVTQIDAAPPATQGETTTYQSGLNFTVSGTVNVSANGPAGGLSVGATWVNIKQTTVPPLIVQAGNTENEGAFWNFKYCTTGLEPDPGTNCTSHVQMVKDVCQAQLGDDSGTNPQQGQTPNGKLSSAAQSTHWQAGSDTRVGRTFNIDVDFVAHLANTYAHLNNGSPGPDPIQGCNTDGCACTSITQEISVPQSVTFEVPFPSTKCSK